MPPGERVRPPSVPPPSHKPRVDSQKPAPARAPADKYLRATPVSEWGVLDYLEKNPALPFKELTHSWVLALSAIKDSTDTAVDQKHKAASLLEAFKEGHDGRLAREWRDRQTAPPAGVVIQNSFNHSNIELNAAPAKALAGLAKGTSGAPRATRGKTAGKKRKRSEGQGHVPSVNKADIPSSEPENSALPRPVFLSSFVHCYQGMRTARKWLLPSGKYLEDILYDNFKDTPVELAVHSWVVDTGDPRVKLCFGEEDWKAISEHVMPLPETDRVLVESMRRFMGLQTVVDLRDTVYSTSFLQAEEVFDVDKHQGPAWVDFVMRSFLHLYENPTLFDNQENSENWYIVYIWSSLFDRSMLTLPGSRISRGESTSTPATERKNRDPTKRKRPGHLYDGVLHIDNHEAGAMEHAKRFTTETSRKWVADGLKVVKVLHDMLYHLEARMNYDLDVLRRLPVVGLVAAGLHHQLLRMNYGQGHVCLLASEKPRQVPTTVADYEPLFEILVNFWRYRTIMQRFKANATCRSATSEDLVEKLMNAGSGVLRGEHVLPRSVETDGE